MAAQRTVNSIHTFFETKSQLGTKGAELFRSISGDHEEDAETMTVAHSANDLTKTVATNCIERPSAPLRSKPRAPRTKTVTYAKGTEDISDDVDDGDPEMRMMKKATHIVHATPEIEYTKLKRILRKEFGFELFDKCKGRIQKILKRRKNAGVYISSSLNRIAKADSTHGRRKSSSHMSIVELRRLSRLSRSGSNLSGSFSPNVTDFHTSSPAVRKERRRSDYASALARAKRLSTGDSSSSGSFLMNDHHLGDSFDRPFKTVDSAPSPAISVATPAPESGENVSTEVLILVSTDEVLHVPRHSTKDNDPSASKIAPSEEVSKASQINVFDYNENLIKALRWVNGYLLIQRKRVSSGTYKVGDEDVKCDLHVAVLHPDDMFMPQLRTIVKNHDSRAGSDYYYCKKTRRSTWTSPIALRTNTHLEHIDDHDNRYYESMQRRDDSEGGNIERMVPKGFQSNARRPAGSDNLVLFWSGVETTVISRPSTGVSKDASDFALAKQAIGDIRARRRVPWLRRKPIKVLYLGKSRDAIDSLRFKLAKAFSNEDEDGLPPVYICGAVVPHGLHMDEYCTEIAQSLISKPLPIHPSCVRWSLSHSTRRKKMSNDLSNIDKNALPTDTPQPKNTISIFQSSKSTGKYVIIPGKIGAGSYGAIFPCVSETGAVVAMKMIDKEKAHKRGKDKDLNHELTISCWLSKESNHHPNILRFLEIFEEKQKIYIVMELARGSFFHKLKVLFQKPWWNESKARSYFKQMMCGLQFMHQSGISHRDLKPENVLIGGPLGETLMLCDFGLSNWVRSKEYFSRRSKKKTARNFDLDEADDDDGAEIGTHAAGSGSVSSNSKLARFQNTFGRGTYMYMAPEMWMSRNANSYDGFKVDVFAMGVILFVMTHKRYPFFMDSITHLIKQYKFGVDPTPGQLLSVYDASVSEGMSDDLKDLLKQMICIDAKSRIDVEGVMSHPWLKTSSVEGTKSEVDILSDLQMSRRFSMKHSDGNGAFSGKIQYLTRGRLLLYERYFDIWCVVKDCRVNLYKNSGKRDKVLRHFFVVTPKTKVGKITPKSSDSCCELMVRDESGNEDESSRKRLFELRLRGSREEIEACRAALKKSVENATKGSRYGKLVDDRDALTFYLDDLVQNMKRGKISYEDFIRTRRKVLAMLQTIDESQMNGRSIRSLRKKSSSELRSRAITLAAVTPPVHSPLSSECTTPSPSNGR